MPQLIMYLDLPDDFKIDEEPKFLDRFKDQVISLEMNDEIKSFEWEIL